MAGRQIDTVVFDLGGVLIDWDPRHLYRKLFEGDEAAMERFLREVCSPEWNRRQDAGRSWAEAVRTLTRAHPDLADMIAAYDLRWPEMLGGSIDESVRILDDLRATGVRLLAMTNWSTEKWPFALARFGFLGWFEAIVVSGEIGAAKPDAAIFRHLLDRFGLVPAATLFIDDTAANCRAAADLGMVVVHFVGAPQLRRSLESLGLLGQAPVPRGLEATRGGAPVD